MIFINPKELSVRAQFPSDKTPSAPVGLLFFLDDPCSARIFLSFHTPAQKENVQSENPRYNGICLVINGCIVLTLKDVDIDATIKKVEQLLKEEKNLSPALRSMIEMLILVVALLVNRLGLNSSKPLSISP